MATKKYVNEQGRSVVEDVPPKPADPGLERLTAALIELAAATATAANATAQNAELLGRLVERTDSIERQVRGQTEAAAKALAKMKERSQASHELVDELRRSGYGKTTPR